MFKVAERVPSAGQFTDLQSNKVDIRVHGCCDLRGIVALIDIFENFIVRETYVGGKQVGFVFHDIAAHIEKVELLKYSSLPSMELIVTNFMKKHNPPHDFIQIPLDEDVAIAFDDLVYAFLMVKVHIFDEDTKLFCDAFRLSGSGSADYRIGAADDFGSAVQVNQYPHLLFW